MYEQHQCKTTSNITVTFQHCLNIPNIVVKNHFTKVSSILIFWSMFGFHHGKIDILSLLFLLLLELGRCAFPYLTGEHHLTESFPVSVYVQVNEDVFFSTEGDYEIARLRNKLSSIYPVHSPGLLSLTVNTTSLNLISSPVLISHNFTVQYKVKDGKRNRRHAAEQHDHQPYCNYISTDEQLEGVFNLCLGVNGHFIDGDRYNKIKSNISHGTLIHLSSTSPSTQVPSLHNRYKKSFQEPWSNQSSGRYKRNHVNTYHLELYIVIDHDFYNRICEKNETYCIDKIWSYNLGVAWLIDHGFGINLVIVGIEVWTEGNLVDIDTNRLGSHLDTVSGWFEDEINDYAINVVGGAKVYDGFMYFSSTTSPIHGDAHGVALIDKTCYNNSYAYVDVKAGDRFELGVHTITHELGHSLGGRHIRDYGTFSECWCYPKMCVMGEGE